MTVGMEGTRWGTWEELVLGGAVLRHGTRAWDAVASELRARTLCLYGFTPKECEARYEDLQERFSGCTAWFEELRKQRVAELKRELEKSEDFIGLLQSKLETLIAKRESNSTNDCETESNVPSGNREVKFLVKEEPKDGLSAGSFTEDKTISCAPDTPILVPPSPQIEAAKADISEESEKEKASVLGSAVLRARLTKSRGKRKRRDCKEVKQGSAGERDLFSSVNPARDNEESTCNCDQNVGSSSISSMSTKVEESDLAGILHSIMEQGSVSVFHRRLKTQKRAKYKKMIRRHLDLWKICARISNGLISSIKELFRDLLLLSNNALVFYPKESLEHKSALSLRTLAIKKFHQLTRTPVKNPTTIGVHLVNGQRYPVRARSMRPRKRSITANKVSDSPSPAPDIDTAGNANLPANTGMKRSVGRPAKRGRDGNQKRAKAPVKRRKIAQRR